MKGKSNNIYIKEFCHRVRQDGLIIIKRKHIYKLKDIEHLTVDLKYDANIQSFLDNDNNVYKII